MAFVEWAAIEGGEGSSEFQVVKTEGEYRKEKYRRTQKIKVS